MKVIWYLFIASFLSFIVYITINDSHDENSKYMTPTNTIEENFDPPEQVVTEDENIDSVINEEIELDNEYILNEKIEEESFFDTHEDDYLEEDYSSLNDFNFSDTDDSYGILDTGSGDYLGKFTKNKYESDRINPSDYFDDKYSTDGPKLYNDDGEFRGNLNGNKYDPDSISNPYGKYGSKYSSDSINNPYGAGSKYDYDSPNNPYGDGWSVFED